MHRASLFRNTAVRLAVTFAMLFAVIYLLAGVATIEITKARLDARADRLIEETSSVIAASYGSADITDLTDSVNSYAVAAPGKDRIFLLSAADGQTLAGNIAGATLVPGWSSVTGTSIRADSGRTYRVFTRKVGPAFLSVGMSDADTQTLQNIAMTSFGWISVLALALAVAGGVLVGRRAQHRLDGVAKAMNAVGRGDLQARVAVSGLGDDIDQVAGQINGALERLSALVEGMRQVSSDIAHELRTPLNRLALTVNGALEKAALGRDVSADLEEAEAECFRLSATFDALLRIAQIESGARKSRFATLSVRPIFEAIGDAYTSVAEESGQHFEWHIPAGRRLQIFGDRDLLTQMLSNLVENALRHTPEGARVGLDITENGGLMRITVSDNGPGIPEAERERVFRRLYRLDKARTIAGSGLGLSLVKAIAELHGGHVELSDNNPGLKATVSVPAA